MLARLGSQLATEVFLMPLEGRPCSKSHRRRQEGSHARALEQTLPGKETSYIIYLIFKTGCLKYVSGPVCVMAEAFHVVCSRIEMLAKMQFLCLELTLHRRTVMCMTRGRFCVFYFARKQFQCTPHWSPYAVLDRSVIKIPPRAHKNSDPT